MERPSMGGATVTRRSKWQYPPPQPAPKILHFPPRPRKRPPKPSPSKPPPPLLPSLQNDTRGMLVSLFDQERSFTRGVEVEPVVQLSPRERVDQEEDERGGNSGSTVALVEEEKWRFQAEMLRAECNLLRMERDIAVKKMERRRVETERAFKSALQTLVSGRKNISEGMNMRAVLDEQINELLEKLEKLQKKSRVTGLEVKKCSNFDKQVCFLQRRLEKFGGFSDEEICVKEIREIAEASLSIQTSSQGDESLVSNGNSCVEILRRKMERLSKGVLLERMEEEYGSMLSTTNSSATSSASCSKRIDYSDLSLSSRKYSCEDKMPHEARTCSGHCKAIMHRIVEQVRAETEQWSQMQEMLGQVRDEMKELQKCRDFWEDRALDSDCQIQSLQSVVKEWRQKALSSETKANELHARVSVLHEEIDRLRNQRDMKAVRSRNASPVNQEAQNETKKQVLACRIKENHCANNNDGCKAQTCIAARHLPRRLPLREIGNMTALMKQHGEGVLPLFCLGNDREMKCSV